MSSRIPNPCLLCISAPPKYLLASGFANVRQTSTLEEQRLILRAPGLDAEKLADLLEKSLNYARAFDEAALEHWKKIAEKYNLSLTRNPMIGQPNLSGTVQSLPLKIFIGEGGITKTIIQISFPDLISDYLILLGKDFDIEQEKYSDFQFRLICQENVYLHSNPTSKFSKILDNNAILVQLSSLFKNNPSSYLEHRRLNIVMAGKPSHLLDKRTADALALASDIVDSISTLEEE